MIGWVGGGCMRRIAGLGLLLLVLGAVWHYRDDLANAARERLGRAADEPSPELARAAESKLATLSTAASPVSISLTEVELQSLVRYSYVGYLPSFIASPTVALRRDRIRLEAKLPTDRLSALAELTDLLAILPDTTEVGVTAQLIPLDNARVALAVDELTVTAGKIPIPRRFIPPILDQLGREAHPGLPPDALALPLPPGADGAYVRGDLLVFIGRNRAPASE